MGLAVLSAKTTDVLVLDEPTNHLDIPAIEQLEIAIRQYRGTVIVVTHAERFAANVRFGRALDLGDMQEDWVSA